MSGLQLSHWQWQSEGVNVVLITPPPRPPVSSWFWLQERGGELVGDMISYGPRPALTRSCPRFVRDRVEGSLFLSCSPDPPHSSPLHGQRHFSYSLSGSLEASEPCTSTLIWCVCVVIRPYVQASSPSSSCQTGSAPPVGVWICFLLSLHSNTLNMNEVFTRNTLSWWRFYLCIYFFFFLFFALSRTAADCRDCETVLDQQAFFWPVLRGALRAMSLTDAARALALLVEPPPLCVCYCRVRACLCTFSLFLRRLPSQLGWLCWYRGNLMTSLNQRWHSLAEGRSRWRIGRQTELLWEESIRQFNLLS